MRSLEKLAVSKGLVKPETVVKTASKSEKKDFSPTNDFTLNILKLCEGLRSTGFNKQAEEIESKFLLFKKTAADIYNTSKEVGEDLVDAAHPKGSHSLEGVEGDAVVETIVDQKKKIEDIVNKKPTGKLATNKDILSAVKIALAQEEKSGASGAITGTLVGAGASYGISKLWQAVLSKMKPSLVEQVIKETETQLGGKLSKEMSKKVSERVVNETLEKVIKEKIGQKATETAVQQAEKQLAEQVTKSVVQKGTEQAAKGVAETAGKGVAQTAAKTPGMWSRLVSFFGQRASLGAGGGSAATGATVAGEGAAVAAGEGAAGAAAGGAGAGAAATVGAAAAAGIVAAAVTVFVTTKIYDNKFYTDSLKEAGDKLLSELKDVQDIAKWKQHKEKEIVFKNALSRVMASAAKAQTLVSDPKPESLDAIRQYADALQDASTAAYSLSSAARGIYSGDDDMKPGESREDKSSWTDIFSPGTSAAARVGEILFGAGAPSLADVIITGANFSNVAQTALVEVRMAMNKLAEIAGKAEIQKEQSGEKAVDALEKGYQESLGKINQWMPAIKAKKIDDVQKTKLIAWLTKAMNLINKEKGKFEAAGASKNLVVKDYLPGLNNLKSKLDGFEAKWIKG